MLDITEAIKNRLGFGSVKSVKSVSEKNSDGEDVLWIEVVLSEGANVSGEDMAKLTDMLWRELSQTKNKSFPVINYVAANEEIGHEAA